MLNVRYNAFAQTAKGKQGTGGTQSLAAETCIGHGTHFHRYRQTAPVISQVYPGPYLVLNRPPRNAPRPHSTFTILSV